MKENAIHLPGLNGMRSIAALSVLVCHIFYMNIGEVYLIDWPIAHYAVTMFYVISGFLITFLLLKEREKNQKISIKKFYIRRILRIWPIYFLYIIVSAFVMYLYGKSDDFLLPSMLCFLFMAGNFHYFFFLPDLNLVGHLWSIGVEEQFYLFWPWMLGLFNTAKNLLLSVIIFIIIFLILKLFLYFHFGIESNIYSSFKQTRFHCMMIGVIGAILFNQNNLLFLKVFSNKTLQLLAWIFYFAVGLNFFYTPVFITHEIIAVATLIMIIGQIINPIYKLENRYFDFFGRISYGLYVIHPLILYVLASIFIRIEMYYELKWAIFFVLSSVISISLSWLSYKYFEMPFLKLKSKFTVIKSVNIKSKF